MIVNNWGEMTLLFVRTIAALLFVDRNCGQESGIPVTELFFTYGSCINKTVAEVSRASWWRFAVAAFERPRLIWMMEIELDLMTCDISKRLRSGKHGETKYKIINQSNITRKVAKILSNSRRNLGPLRGSPEAIVYNGYTTCTSTRLSCMGQSP